MSEELLRRLRAPMWRQEPVDIQAVARDAADEIARLTAEIEALRHDLERHIEIASQEAMRADGIEARLTAEIARLREALTEARESIQGWGSQASEYLRDKYDLAGDLAAIDAALNGEPRDPAG